MSPESNSVETLSAEVGRRLRERRQDRDETLQSVAAAAEVSVSHLAEIETGKSSCSLPVLLRLSRALEYPVAHILPTLGASRLRAETITGSDQPQRVISHEGLDLMVRSIELEAGASTEIGLDLCDTIVYVVAGIAEVHASQHQATLRVGDSAELRRAPRATVRAVERLSAIVVIGSTLSDTTRS